MMGAEPGLMPTSGMNELSMFSVVSGKLLRQASEEYRRAKVVEREADAARAERAPALGDF